MRKISYKLYTLGCKVNQYDSGNLGKELSKLGFIEKKKEADLAVVNTCSVTKIAIQKGKRMLNKAREENPGAKIILMGCYPASDSLSKEEAQVDLIWGVGKLDGLKKEILKFFPREEKPALISACDFNTDRSRYFIKVQDGCEQFCSYCIIPHNRGPLKSRKEKEIVEEIEEAVRAG